MKISLLILAILMSCVSTMDAQLTINPGGFITINQSASLFVGATLKINSDASGSGYLVDKTNNGDVSIVGNVSIERYIGGNGWHNTASPVVGASTGIYSNTDLVFYYDETIILNDWNFGWVWHQGALSVMKGYDVYLDAALTANYTAADGQSLNTGSYSINITRTNVANGEAENRKGWNLIGNPYPSPVDWLLEAGWDKSDINDAKYIWSPTNNNYTIFLGGSSPTGINDGTRYIPSNQGFWVQATQDGSININNSSRVGIMSSTPDYYKSGDEVVELRLKSSGNGYTDETMIRFLPGATSQFDVNIDASKLFSTNDSVSQICTISDKNLLAINSLPSMEDGLAVSMNFSCKTAGYYSIFMDEKSTIPYTTAIFLVDLAEDKIVNLRTNEYMFFHSPMDKNQRFIIYFNPSNDIKNNISPNDYYSVTSFNKTIYITRNTNTYHAGIIQVFNMLGQKIHVEELSNSKNQKILINGFSGYYIVRIINQNNISNFKIKI